MAYNPPVSPGLIKVDPLIDITTSDVRVSIMPVIYCMTIEGIEMMML